MIEVMRLTTGKLLVCAGAHCVETEADDASVDAATKRLAEMSGTDRARIAMHIVRHQLSAEA